MTAPEPPPAAVHVWTLRTEAADGPSPDDELAVLSPAERLRAEGMADAVVRRDFVLAHALARRALTRLVTARAAEQWEFVYDVRGRPSVAGDDRLRVSLSHAAGVVACAVTVGADCGIDVEPVAATGPRRRVLTAEEAALLEASPPAAAAALYARLWTIKEAYAKARGLGFLLPFDQLNVSLGSPPRLEDGTRESGSGSWQVEQWFPTPRHVAALAVLAARRPVVHHPDYPD